MRTDALIASLAQGVQPVETLSRPWVRAARWAGPVAAYVGLFILGSAPAGTLTLSFGDRRLVLEQAAALLTAVTAAAAAFATVVPGYRRGIVAVPVLCLVAWASLVAAGIADEGGGGSLGTLCGETDWMCAVTILGAALMPAVALRVAIMRGAPLTPSTTAMCAGLAAAAAGSFAVSAVRPVESSAVVLIWHCGTVLMLAGAAAGAGRYLLRWPRASKV